MAYLKHIFLGILILQMYVHAAPSESKLEDIAKVAKPDDTPSPEQKQDVEGKSDSTENPRQKRYYNPFQFGFPATNPGFSDSNQRDNLPYQGYFGPEDPIAQIHRRVQEIANIARQPAPPPPPPIPQVPIFYPVWFVPSFDCACNPNSPQPVNPSGPNSNNPNVTTRFPALDDNRQNWGLVNNDITNNNDEGEDFSRPISLKPVRFDRPPSRPVPPVDRETIQSGTNSGAPPPSSAQTFTTTSPPSFSTQGFNAPLPETQSFNPPRPSTRPPPQNLPPAGPPTQCDGAILSCCHQAEVLYECFAQRGCPTSALFGNPCEPNTILRVIEKFQRFYGSRSG